MELFNTALSFYRDSSGLPEADVVLIKDAIKDFFNISESIRIAPSHTSDQCVVVNVMFADGDNFNVFIFEDGLRMPPPPPQEEQSLLFSTDPDFLLKDLTCDGCGQKNFKFEDSIWTNGKNDFCETCRPDAIESYNYCTVWKRIQTIREEILRSTGFEVEEEDEPSGM